MECAEIRESSAPSRAGAPIDIWPRVGAQVRCKAHRLNCELSHRDPTISCIGFARCHSKWGEQTELWSLAQRSFVLVRWFCGLFVGFNWGEYKLLCRLTTFARKSVPETDDSNPHQNGNSCVGSYAVLRICFKWYIATYIYIFIMAYTFI